MKRIFDFISAMLVAILASPLLLVIGMVIYAFDRGPIFFLQKRVGLGGKEFKIYKFRTMVINSESIGPYFTTDKDPRITFIGRFLRKSSLDELPQLFNVIFGDMSVVGPRPNVPAQRDLYSESDWNLRHSVLPGITGLAQATARSSASEEKRLEADLYYVQNQSLFFDLKIIFLTIEQVFFKGGN